MKNRLLYFILVFITVLCCCGVESYAKNLLAKDKRTQDIKYQYGIMQRDLKKEQTKTILDLNPSGFMTREEYEKASEYKDRQFQKIDIPKLETPSDFKYIPRPTYTIVKYNDPPGSVELSLGKRIYQTHLINTQGIASADVSKLVYSAVYYYSDSASVASEIFLIPLDTSDTELNRLLKANVSKREPKALISTDKVIDNRAAFRTLTPVDFSVDGNKILVKEKIGSREDGIWLTTIFVYDFETKMDYDLSEIRDSITYFWNEYMKVNLDDKRWDIYPLGFDEENPDRIIVQAFGYTGEKPVFLGTWSIDTKGTQSRLVSFDINYEPKISVNGVKLVQSGVQDYSVTEKEIKNSKILSDRMKKDYLKAQKEKIDKINIDYKYRLEEIKAALRQDLKDNKKLQSYKGSTEDTQIIEAYKQYLIDQRQKDIIKSEKQIIKVQTKIDKIDNELDILNGTNENKDLVAPIESE